MSMLKRCPFCGSAAHVWEDERYIKTLHDFPKWYISCLGCGVQTPTAKIEQVVKIWNRRKDEQTS